MADEEIEDIVPGLHAALDEWLGEVTARASGLQNNMVGSKLVFRLVQDDESCDDGAPYLRVDVVRQYGTGKSRVPF